MDWKILGLLIQELLHSAEDRVPPGSRREIRDLPSGIKKIFDDFGQGGIRSTSIPYSTELNPIFTAFIGTLLSHDSRNLTLPTFTQSSKEEVSLTMTGPDFRGDTVSLAYDIQTGKLKSATLIVASSENLHDSHSLDTMATVPLLKYFLNTISDISPDKMEEVAIISDFSLNFRFSDIEGLTAESPKVNIVRNEIVDAILNRFAKQITGDNEEEFLKFKKLIDESHLAAAVVGEILHKLGTPEEIKQLTDLWNNATSVGNAISPLVEDAAYINPNINMLEYLAQNDPNTIGRDFLVSGLSMYFDKEIKYAINSLANIFQPQPTTQFMDILPLGGDTLSHKTYSVIGLGISGDSRTEISQGELPLGTTTIPIQDTEMEVTITDETITVLWIKTARRGKNGRTVVREATFNRQIPIAELLKIAIDTNRPPKDGIDLTGASLRNHQ